MAHDFRTLLRLSETDLSAYRVEVTRLRDDDPERFGEFLKELSEALAREGWSRARRISSISALALGEIDVLLAKHRGK